MPTAEKKESLTSVAVEKLKDRALEYLRRFSTDQQKLRDDREAAQRAYRRESYPEDWQIPAGSRSKFVTSDLFDTIEWIIPSLMRIFYSGRDVVKIEGVGQEDEAGAILLNQKVNWDITRQNNGFLIFLDWFKSSMLDRASAVKYYWESKDETRKEDYEGLTDDEFAALQTPDYIVDEDQEEVLQEENAIPAEMPGMMPITQPRIVVHHVKGRRIVNRIRRPVAEVLPPEELIMDLKARDIKKEPFVAHRKRVLKWDLMQDYDLDEEDLEAAMDFTGLDEEETTRFEDLGGTAYFRDMEDQDYYYIHECSMYEETEKGRDPILLTLLGNQVIEKKENSYGHPNYCMLSPIRVPHRQIGMSIADLLLDIQKLNSSVTRFILNNIYYQTDGMLVVNPWKVDVADFVTQRRPGGIVRTSHDTNPADAIYPVPVQPLAGHAFGMLEQIQGIRENRTGVTRYNQGADADSLNKTASGISQILSASQQRIELIARIFAETGVRDLMTAFAKMNIDYLDIETSIRLNEQWQRVDPKAIDVNFDVTIDVALGTGSKDQKIQQLMAIEDRSLNAIFLQSGLIQPMNLFNIRKATLIEMGFKQVEQFITPPPVPPPEQVPGPVGGPPNVEPGAGMGPDQGQAGIPAGAVGAGAGMVGAGPAAA